MYSESLTQNLQKGMMSKEVRYVQEWLTLQNYGVTIDGKFGKATEYALKEFQSNKGLNVTGIVDINTWTELYRPIIIASTRIQDMGPISNLIIKLAYIHLSFKPREIGGQNMGPWVRFYTRGFEGVNYPWCAGFVSTIVTQAFACKEIPVNNFKYTLSCDNLMEYAKEKKTVIDIPVPGCIFVVRGSHPGDWIHTGIVTDVIDGDVFRGCEGNTNTNGSREGYEVCLRRRSTEGKDFILIR